MLQPLVAVSTDVKHLDNYDWHAAPKQYLEAAIAGAGVFPVLVPSFGDRLDLDQLLASVDGVMLTGAKSNVASVALWRRRQRGERPLRPRPRRDHACR